MFWAYALTTRVDIKVGNLIHGAFCVQAGRRGIRMTWREVAMQHPAFVEWIVQTKGPLPEGEVNSGEYQRYAHEYLTARGAV